MIHYEFYQYALLVAVGALTGVLGGMLGIGGSIIMIPAMIWILGTFVGGHEQLQQYMAVAMIVNFLLSIPSVAAHARKKAIWPSVVKYIAPAGMIGAGIGVYISNQFTGDAVRYLRWFLGAFFVYVAVDTIVRMFLAGKSDGWDRGRVEAISWVPKAGAGLSVGVLAGMTGLGGGALAVPINQHWLKMPLRNAIANSSALIVCVAAVTSLAKNATLSAADGTVDRSLILSACLAPTAMIGSYLGGHLTHTLPLRTVRLVFASLILASSWKMFAGLGEFIGF